MPALVLFCVCYPTGPMSVEEVPMDPEVMLTVDRLYLSGTLRGFAAAVSDG